MISLSDTRLQLIMIAGAGLEPERRDIFLQRVASMLNLRGRYQDRDVSEVADLALCGLVQRAAS